ncbi:Retrovirus-related Pol polyprotein from transposon RE1 [Vitis vinifera]|uniref:Retrovirus-related Pol polyprotein from transposon RE1 n=1 Tax=Vitis vinifera TaxID=29760 RepID=A0A438HRG4_VITVI|nr:Retrovirus-related Pol polyprotein from transposon RE1 [Vitis vinifera]
MRQRDTVEGAFQARMQKNADHKNGKKHKKNNNKPNSNNQKNGVFPSYPHCKKTNHSPQKCWWRPDVKCNKCGKQGHVERICKNQQQEETSATVDQCQEEQLFATTCVANKSTCESWLVDSGCTNHMTNDQDLFTELDKTTISKVRIGNGDVGQLAEKGFKAYFEDRNCIIKDAEGKEVFNIKIKGKSFALNLLEDEHAVVLQQDSTTMIWHRRLGHFHHDVVLYLKKNQIAEGLSDLEKNLPICDAYQYGRKTKLSFPKKTSWRATQKQQLVHTDVGGPQKTPSLKGKKWSWDEKMQQYKDENVDELLVRDTRKLSDIYYNVVVLEPAGFEEAIEDEKWWAAMQDELNMIEKNNTWELVDRSSHKKPIGVKGVYRTKLNLDGSINKYKARLVVKGYEQMLGVDFSETFAPITRLDTIRMLLAIATQKGWRIYQLDVKSAFLNGYLEEEIFFEQPEGFYVKGKEDKVYLLKKALYGLKTSPKSLVWQN